MQFVCWLFIVVALVATENIVKADIGNVISVSSGTSFGRCIGHCRQSVTMMFNPLQVITSREANFNQASYPPIHVRSPLSLAEWVNLVSLVNLDVFQKLDDRIGCPDCADGGAEWIQIDWTNGSKRVTFENGRTVEGIENLIEKVRSVRKSYLSKV